MGSNTKMKGDLAHWDGVCGVPGIGTSVKNHRRASSVLKLWDENTEQRNRSKKSMKKRLYKTLRIKTPVEEAEDTPNPRFLFPRLTTVKTPQGEVGERGSRSYGRAAAISLKTKENSRNERPKLVGRCKSLPLDKNTTQIDKAPVSVCDLCGVDRQKDKASVSTQTDAENEKTNDQTPGNTKSGNKTSGHTRLIEQRIISDQTAVKDHFKISDDTIQPNECNKKISGHTRLHRSSVPGQQGLSRDGSRVRSGERHGEGSGHRGSDLISFSNSGWQSAGNQESSSSSSSYTTCYDLEICRVLDRPEIEKLSLAYSDINSPGPLLDLEADYSDSDSETGLSRTSVFGGNIYEEVLNPRRGSLSAGTNRDSVVSFLPFVQESPFRAYNMVTEYPERTAVAKSKIEWSNKPETETKLVTPVILENRREGKHSVKKKVQIIRKTLTEKISMNIKLHNILNI